jgi:hypothetical protein
MTCAKGTPAHAPAPSPATSRAGPPLPLKPSLAEISPHQPGPAQLPQQPRAPQTQGLFLWVFCGRPAGRFVW